MEYKLENTIYHTTNVWKNSKGAFEFCVWAPFVREMYVEIRKAKHTVSNPDIDLAEPWAKEWHIDSKTNDKKSIILELKKGDDFCFRGSISGWRVKWGDMYRFILETKSGKVYSKDPRAICQPHIYSWSKLYDNNKYRWSCNERKWQQNKIKQKLSVKDKTLRQLHNFTYVEAHIPTATQDGTLTAFKNVIDEIAQQGFGGVLLMPAEGTYDVNWGYDGVDKYAVTRAWGKNFVDKNVCAADKINDELKSLVDYAHKKGINVGIDWVPSHISEEFGNVLPYFGQYENVNTEQNACAKNWGGFTFNLEGKKSSYITDEVKQVRRYITDIPLHLIESYHFDFLRGDQSPNMYSNTTMKLVKAEMHYHFPDVAVIWEDHRTDEHLTEELCEECKSACCNETHRKAIENIMANETSCRNIGGDEIWDFDFSHALEANILDCPIWPVQANVENLAKFFNSCFQGTKFLLSHDEIGNHCGARILTKYVNAKLKFNPICDNPQMKHYLAAECAAKLLECGLYDHNVNINDIGVINQILEFYFVKKNTLMPETLQKIFREALAYDRLGHTCVYLATGSKMIFQGENYGEINPFLFHRIQPVEEAAVSLCKGYDIGKMGFYKSKLDREHHFSENIYNLFKELNRLCEQGEFLTDAKFEIRKVHNLDRILAFERISEKGEHILALLNFATQAKAFEFSVPETSPKEYFEILNTDNVEFGGETMSASDLNVHENYISKIVPAACAIIYKSR